MFYMQSTFFNAIRIEIKIILWYNDDNKYFFGGLSELRAYTDWNCRLLPMMSDLVSNPQETVEALTLLRDRFGLKRFYMMPEFDCQAESVPMFLLKRERAKKEVLALLPEDIRLEFSASSLLLPNLSKTPMLHKLHIPRTNDLAIRLSPFDDEAKVAPELNRMLYHTPYRIVFLSFEQCVSRFSSETVQRLLKQPNVAFQFNFSALDDPIVREILHNLVRKNKTVFFGTGINSLGKACYYEFDHYVSIAQNEFSDYERDVLFFPKQFPSKRARSLN